MSPTTPIIISGSIAIDRIMAFKGKYSDHLHPDKLDSLSISIFLDSLIDSYGGVGGNIAYSMALLHDHPVLLGAAGPDAKPYLNSLSALGVDTSYVHESIMPTATFNVITDAAQNQVGGFYPGAMFDSETLSFEPWKNQDPLVVVSPHDPKAMRRQVTEVTKWNIRLCYDVGQQVSNLDAADIAAGVDAASILILNDYELAALSTKIGRSVDSLRAKVPLLITTLGQDGSVISGASVTRPIHVPIASPEKVVDPTGAGDAYRAGLLFGLTRDWDLKTCAQLGATVASYAIEHHGTQNHTFTLADLTARYRASFNRELPKLTKGSYAHH